MLNIKKRADLKLDKKRFVSVCNLEDNDGIGKNYTLHGHEFFELELCIGGAGKQILNGEKYDFTKGMLQLITTRDVHDVFYDYDFEHYNIRFNQESIDQKLLSRVFALKGNIVTYLSEDEYGQVLSMMKMAFEVSRKYYDDSEDILFAETLLKDLVEIIIIKLLNKLKNEEQAGKKQSNYILRAMEYTEENFMKKITAEDVSNFLGLNRNYFSTIFHENTGKTYKKYLTEVKLNYARNLICGTELSIAEIALRCGFGSSNSLIREFTSTFGAPPLKYRHHSRRTADDRI